MRFVFKTLVSLFTWPYMHLPFRRWCYLVLSISKSLALIADAEKGSTPNCFIKPWVI